MTAESHPPFPDRSGHPSPGSRAPRGTRATRATRATAKAPSLSAAHKSALAAGRNESRAVRRYLQALNVHGRDGAGHTPESMQRRIEAIDAELAIAVPAAKVRLIEERMDLYAQLKAVARIGSLEELEQEFVSAAGSYSLRKGITYEAWREVGVDDSVLARAGLTPSS